MGEFWAALGTPPADLFDRVTHWVRVRLKMIQGRHEAYRLIADAYTSSPPALRAQILASVAPMQADAWRRLREGIDPSPLRPDITIDQAIRALMLIQSGLEQTLMPRIRTLPDRGLSQLEAMTQESFFYLRLLRDALYRPDAPRPALDPLASDT